MQLCHVTKDLRGKLSQVFLVFLDRISVILMEIKINKQHFFMVYFFQYAFLILLTRDARRGGGGVNKKEDKKSPIKKFSP